MIQVYFITVPEGEDIVNISSPLFLLGFALLRQRCSILAVKILANDTAILGGSMCFEIVLSIELE